METLASPGKAAGAKRNPAAAHCKETRRDGSAGRGLPSSSFQKENGMSARILRAALAGLALLLALPQLAAAQNWRVFDTFTQTNVIPGPGVSDLGDLQVGFIAQRIYQVFNQTTSSPAHLGPCSTLGSSSFIVANGTGAGGSVYPGVPTGLHIQFSSNVLGNHQATVFCQGSIGNFSFTVRGRMLDPNPYIILQTSAGANVAKNSTINFGSVQAGTAADRDFKIINLGNQPLTVSLSTTGSSAFSVAIAPPSSIARGGEATFRLRFLSATAVSNATAQLRINNNDPNDNPYNVNLTGTATAAPAPQIQVTDNGNGGATVAKGATVNIGSATPNAVLTRTFTVRNTGNATLTISNPSTFLTGSGFTISSFPASSVIAGSSTSFTIRFQASTVTSYLGTVSLSNNDSDDNPFFFNVQASVVPNPVPRIRIVNETTGQTLVPGSSSVSFGTPAPNASVTHSFRIYNDGGATLTLSNPGSFVSGSGFSLSSSPSSSIPAGGNTTFSIRFLASATGAYSGSASLLHNDTAVSNPFGFSLTANVQIPIVPRLRVTNDGGLTLVSGATYDFGGVNTGSSSNRTFYFYNDGNTPLSLSAASLTGSAFSVIQGLPSSIPAGGSAALIVRFSPTAVGAATGRLTWSTNDPSVPSYVLNLAGTGLGAKIRVVVAGSTSVFNGGTYNYGSTAVGTPISRLFTIYNDGNVALTINYSLDTTEGWVTLEAPSTSIAPGASGTFRIRLHSATAGAKTARVNLLNNDASVPNFFFNLQGQVTGTGPQPDIRVVSGDGVTISPGLLYTGFPSTPAGTPTSRAFVIYNDGTADLTVSGVTVTGSAFSLIVAPPATIAPGSSGVFRVRIHAATAGTYNGTVSVGSNDPDENPLGFSVRGTVTP